MTRKQVPPGTRNARTGAYIRKPVRVTGGKPPKKGWLGCALVLLGWAGAAVAVIARLRGLV